VKALQVLIDSISRRYDANPESSRPVSAESSPFKLPKSRTIDLLSSPLGVTSREEKFQGYPKGLELFGLLTGYYTTHWGLKVEEKSYDLKRSGFVTLAQSNFAHSNLPERDAREVVSTAHLGRTHFGHDEIVDSGMFRATKRVVSLIESLQEIILSRIISGTAASSTTASHLR
jgi:hypothetical protein